jgi:maltose-binding protein MalE
MLQIHRCFVLLLALMLLGACDMVRTPQPPPSAIPTATPRPTPAPPPPTEAPPITALPQPTPEPSALSVWAVGTEAQADALQRVSEGAAAQAGVDVHVTVKSPDTLQADVRSNALAGLPQPDLFWGSQEDLGLLQRDELITTATDGQSTDAFIPATVAAATLDGQRWGTPLAADGFLLLLYNKKIAAAAPQTTDALIVASRDIKNSGKVGLVSAWAEPRWFVAWLTGTGGALVGPYGAPTLDTPQVIAALNMLKELRVGGPSTPSTYDDGVALFTQGGAAFNIDGNWAIDDYRQYTDTLDLGVARMPLVPGTGRIAAPPLNGVYLMYGKDLTATRRPKAAMLMNALLAPAGQAALARELHMLPAKTSALGDEAVQSDPVLSKAAAQLDGAVGLPATKGVRCAFRVLAVALPEVLLGEWTPEQATEHMQTDATACVSKP